MEFMRVLDELFLAEASSVLNHASSPDSFICIEKVIKGLKNIGVTLTNGWVGMAGITELEHLSDEATELTRFRGKHVEEVLPELLPKDGLDRSIAFSLLNALFNQGFEDEKYERDFIIEAGNEEHVEKVCMVGHIPAIARGLKGKMLLIHDEWQGMSPGTSLQESIDACDLAILTSTMLINKTVGEVLEAKSVRKDHGAGCKVALVGPSTPLCVDVWKKMNVAYVGGVVPLDGEKFIEVISTRGGPKDFVTSSRKKVSIDISQE
jgi:uncharacterized protein